MSGAGDGFMAVRDAYGGHGADRGPELLQHTGSGHLAASTLVHRDSGGQLQPAERAEWDAGNRVSQPRNGGLGTGLDDRMVSGVECDDAVFPGVSSAGDGELVHWGDWGAHDT